MSDRYRKVYIHTTTDPWYRSLPTDHHRLLWLHMLISPEHRDFGLFRVDVRDTARVVHEIDVEAALLWFQEQGRLCFDNNADMLFLPKALSFETLVRNANQATGIVKQIKPYGDHWGVGLLWAAATQYEPKLATALRRHCNDLNKLQPVPETARRLFPELVSRVEETMPGLFPLPEHVTLNPENVVDKSRAENTSVVGERVLDDGMGPDHWGEMGAAS